MPQVFFRLISMLLETVEKGADQKDCPRYFQIRKYAFLNIWKREWAKKNAPGLFEIAKYAFLNIRKRVWAKKLSQVFLDSQVCFFKYLKKGMRKKNIPGILRLVSMLF